MDLMDVHTNANHMIDYVFMHGYMKRKYMPNVFLKNAKEKEKVKIGEMIID